MRITNAATGQYHPRKRMDPRGALGEQKRRSIELIIDPIR